MVNFISYNLLLSWFSHDLAGSEKAFSGSQSPNPKFSFWNGICSKFVQDAHFIFSFCFYDDFLIVKEELEFLTASSQKLVKMYLRRKEEEEEEEEDSSDTDDHIQISYKLGYIQVNIVFFYLKLKKNI